MTINCLSLNTIHQLPKRQFRIYNHFSLFAFHFSFFIFHFSLFTHIPSSKYSLASLFTLHFSLVPPSGARGIIHSSLFTFHLSLFTFHSSLFTLHFSLFTFHSSLFAIHFSLFAIHSLYFSSDHFQVLLIGHSKPYRLSGDYLHHITLCHGMAYKGRNIELRLRVSLMFGYKSLK